MSRSFSQKNRDFILFSALILLSALLLFARHTFTKEAGKRVIISQDGVIIREYALSESRTEVIPASNGGSNTLHIEGGAVWVTDATCPDKICEHSGKISLPGELIVCLPNRLTIQISD